MWATVLLLVDLFIGNKRTTAYLALAGLVLAALLGLIAVRRTLRATAFSGMAVLDNTAIVIDWILALVAAVTILLLDRLQPAAGHRDAASTTRCCCSLPPA